MTLRNDQSKKHFAEAKDIFPGGVNSPVRAFGSVGGQPLFIESAKGPYVYDEDGNQYIDYVNSWGPAIVGHAHPEVIAAVSEQMQKGFSFGAPTRLETELATLVKQLVPSMEMMRFVSSGTEACMSVLRLARGYTGRDKIIKFSGCYHGHADMLLVQAGSGVATLGIPGSPGVPQGATKDTLVAPYNNLNAVRELISQAQDQVAAVILEPIAGNANFIRPTEAFLKGLRELCSEHNILLIFDEVMTGFRVHPNSAQGLYGIKPDLSTFGKVMGGGMPLGAYGGRRDIMERIAPTGPVYQAGTLSGNPLAVMCGLKTLELLNGESFSYSGLADATRSLVEGLSSAAADEGHTFSADSEGGMFGFAFAKAMPTNFEEAQSADIPSFNRFFQGMLSQGVYLAPSAFEAGFVTMAHSNDVSEETISKAKTVFMEMKH